MLQDNCDDDVENIYERNTVEQIEQRSDIKILEQKTDDENTNLPPTENAVSNTVVISILF